MCFRDGLDDPLPRHVGLSRICCRLVRASEINDGDGWVLWGEYAESERRRDEEGDDLIAASKLQ